MDNPYPWLQDFINQVPEWLQPLMVAAVAAIPYVEGEGAAALGIIAGINPVIAAVAAIAGNVLCVLAVVLLSSRLRRGVTARRAERARSSAAAASSDESDRDALPATAAVTSMERGAVNVIESENQKKSSRRSKGQAKLRRWLVRFGVPGASLLAPIALPTMLTAAFFVASGVRKEWVILWQIIAIALWTGAVAVVATGALALLGW